MKKIFVILTYVFAIVGAVALVASVVRTVSGNGKLWDNIKVLFQFK